MNCPHTTISPTSYCTLIGPDSWWALFELKLQLNCFRLTLALL